MKQIFKLISIAMFIFVAASAQASSVSGKAKDFTLKSRDGKTVSLSQYRGQVVMLNFWASWCGPCRQEMPLLENLSNKYGKYGFTLLGVNVEQDSSQALAYLKDVKVTFPILFDTTNSTSKLYGVSAMPTTIIIDKNGNMRFKHAGYKPGYEKDYKKQIKQLIRE